MKNIKSTVKATVLVIIIYMAAAMIVSPSDSAAAAESGLNICAQVIIPSLFPFIFCSNMAIALGAARILSRYLSKIMLPLFGVSGGGALALVLGIISGYPVGAVCATELYTTGECTKTEAERLLAFCNNSGPMFIIGALGTGMLGNHRLGILLYITHISSALICGMIFKKWGKTEKTRAVCASKDEHDIKTAAPDIGAAVCKSVDTTLAICGFVIIFAVFTAVLPQTSFRKYIYAILEITGGLRELANNAGLPVIAGVTAFSGISVMAQVMSIITPAGLSVLPYILGKLTHAIIAFLLTYIAISFTPGSENVFSMDYIPITAAFDPMRLFGVSVMLIALTALSVAVALVIAKLFEHYCK